MTEPTGLRRQDFGDGTYEIIRVFYEVYREMGAGFLESVYQNCMIAALLAAGMQVRSEVYLPVHFRGIIVGRFRADLIVNDRILLEIKARAHGDDAHIAQITNYLRATDLEIALLLRFREPPSFKRIVYSNERKGRRSALLMPE